MRIYFPILLIFSVIVGCSSAQQKLPLPEAKAVNINNTFAMSNGVAINIKAPPEKIWGILTKAEDFQNWNTTVIYIKGKIRLDEDIILKAKIAPDREFELEVSTFEKPKKMVWQDGNFMFKGVRTFELIPQPDGSTRFRMVEVFTGWMLPMIKGSLPDFTPAFEQFAKDLKKKAEAG